MPWAIDQKNVLKVPTGVTHVVLDTPGGIHGFELSKVVMSADAIIMPVCNSMFDRESAQACHAELMALPRVASGRCKLGIVGMRIDARTRSSDMLREWAQALEVSFLGVLRETQLYVKSLENGQTIFDLAPKVSHADLVQWEPILQWLRPIVKFAPALEPDAATPQAIAPNDNAARMNTPRPMSLMPAQEALVPGDRLGVIASARPAPHAHAMDEAFALARPASSHSRNAVPQFLLRH
jgi:chromosome partitioning protein